MKPIIFNTNMVKAILENRKTVTRRVVKPPALYAIVEDSNGKCVGSWYEDERCGYSYPTIDDCPYSPSDILYVRETWKQAVCDPAGGGAGLRDLYLYKADDSIDTSGMDVQKKWNPSIHMPREAARIFLRVTGVRVERLQDITDLQALAEGCEGTPCNHDFAEYIGGMFTCTDCINTGWLESPTVEFMQLWDSTINPAGRKIFGWDANPWVWVIEFDRISKEEALCTQT